MVQMPADNERFQPQPERVVTADPQILAARIHPDGRRLIAGGFDAAVRIWDLGQREPVEVARLQGHNGWVQAFAISPDGSRLYSGDSWGRLCCWDLTAVVLADVAGPAETGAEAEAPTEPAEATAKPDRQPLVIDRPLWSLADAHDGWLRDIDVRPDGGVLITCGRDRQICLRNAADGQCLDEPLLHTHDVFATRFHPAGEAFVAGDERGVVLVGDATTGRELRRMDAGALYLEHRLQDVGGVRALSFDATGNTLAVGGTTPKNGATVQGTPTVFLFDYATGEKKQTLNFGASTHCFVHEVQFHQAGFVMVVTSGTPGQGQVLFQRPSEEQPFFTHTKIPNCHSISYHAGTGRLAVSGTNRGSNGNGRRLDKNGEYARNNSPIHLFQLPAS